MRVLPDGCMDLIAADGRMFLAGPDTTASLVRTDVPLVGIRFPPGMAPSLLGISAAEVRDLRPDLGDVIGRGRLASDVESLALRLATEAEPPRWTAALVGRLRTGHRTAQVADELGWSPRQLHRKCLHAFGYGPSVLAGIMRFQHAILLAGVGTAFADVAVRAGYADQAHMARETRRLAGTTLGALMAEFGQPSSGA